MKLAILVNKNSASASEILAGAIQDLDAGIVVGPTTTFGKGLVQKIIPLPYDTALKYTIARYYYNYYYCYYD
jgi:carboxyl-terminal processing protease